jgi:hypothetical protein
MEFLTGITASIVATIVGLVASEGTCGTSICKSVSTLAY